MVPNFVKFTLFILIFILASCKADSLIESSKTPEISIGTFSYPSAQYKFEIGQSIEKTLPTLNDRGVFLYSVEPELPPGFYIDEETGGFGGVAIIISPKQTYTFKANLSGVGVEYQYKIDISVTEPIPQLLGYPQNPLKAVFAEALPPVFPIVVGSVDFFELEPALPSGLFFDPISGGIAGTPVNFNYDNIHYLSATNSGGTVTVPINIKVTEKYPTLVTYTAPAYSCLANLVCTIPPPVISPLGVLGLVFTVTPALPPGYTLDPFTGGITAGAGDLVLASPITTYTVKASNSSGNQSTTFTLETVLAAPTDLGYPALPINVFKDIILATPSPIIPAAPVPINAAIERYEILGSSGPTGAVSNLPGGLILNPATGEITGTPNAPVGTYVLFINGINSLGAVTSAITLEILTQPVTMLSYPTFPVYILTGEEIPRYEPSFVGTTPDFYTLTSDPLPPGLLFNNSTGVFYGTPIQPVIGFNASITATNVADPTDIVSLPVNLIINISDPAPTSITYPQSVYNFQACSDISIIPTITGGTPTTIISVPTINIVDQFPPTASSTGLSINQMTGEISGNISTYYPDPKGYFITASNPDGAAPPTALTINTTPDPPIFTMDNFYPYRAVAETQLMNLDSCFNKSESVISPNLPLEFSLSDTNDISYSGITIAGTSPYLIPRKNYSLVLTNNAGSQSDNFDMGLKYRLSSSRNQAESLIVDLDNNNIEDIVIVDANCPIYTVGNCSQGHFSILKPLGINGEYTQIYSQSTLVITGSNLYNNFQYLHSNDMDVDTFSDIIYYDRFQSKFIIMKNEAGSTLTHLNEVFVPVPPTDVIYKDLDNDGIDEIITVDGTSNIIIYQYLAGVFSATVHPINNLAIGTSSIAAVKINSDDFIDLIILDEDDNKLCPIKAIGSNSFESDCLSKISLPQTNAKKIITASISNSVNEDVIIIHQDTISSISILKNDSNDFSTQTFSTPPALDKLVDESIISFGDYNHDGTNDIALTALEGNISNLYIYNGASLFSSPAAAKSVEYPNIRSLSSKILIDNKDALISCHEEAGLGYCQIEYSGFYPLQF